MIPKVKPIGIGELRVVKQQLKGYEDGEIAHIENIMANEYRKRSHRRLRQIEDFTSFEEDRELESEKHLETTERFELQKESQKTIKSETKFEAGVEVSGGFGPVKFSAHVGFSTSSSSEEVQKEASNYAKEIIQKSVEKIKEKVGQSKTSRILEEFEERNEHGFDNVGNGHVIGEYRWLDKTYYTKIKTLSKRLFYEFVIPQPSINYLYKDALKQQHKDVPEKPDFPQIPIGDENGYFLRMEKLRFPSQITRENYRAIMLNGFIAAPSVKPPPPNKTIITGQFQKDISQKQNDDSHDYSLVGEVQIPKGYKTVKAFSKIGFFGDGLKRDIFQVVVGNIERRYFNKYLPSEIDLNSVMEYSVGGIEDKLPIGIKFRRPLKRTERIDPNDLLKGTKNIYFKGHYSLFINIQVECSLSAELYEKWQLETYDAVMQEYNRQLLDYEEKMAELEIQEAVSIGGNNPVINKEIIKDELKRSCIALWLGDSDFENNLLDTDLDQANQNIGPRMRIKEAQKNAQLIKFFETTFDWKNMTYQLYSSFWSTNETPYNVANAQFTFSKSEIDSLTSSDPLFEEFLKAGSARVLLPVKLEGTAQIMLMNILGVYGLDFREILKTNINIYDYLESLLNEIDKYETALEENDSMTLDERERAEDFLQELRTNEKYYKELMADFDRPANQNLIPIPLPEKDEDISADEDHDFLVRVPTNLIRLKREESNSDHDTN
ncbi:hypothetical protein [Aquimarina megaterium]|uniref:hypothetical protein n=1 Tax=Aquimarina megaterium TaxID=1443666 RepID=UPI00046F60FD|nr:hypothetical protein [Aquimarina megaterium]